jgi:cell division protein FtsB
MQKFMEKIKIKPDWKKIGLIFAAVILFFLVMDLNTRLSELSRLSTQRDDAATVVAVLNSTLEVLETQVAFAQSEGAVEEWAYNEGHMVREDEVLIIPLSPPGTTQVPMLVPTPTPEPVANWEIWLALLLGN